MQVTQSSKLANVCYDIRGPVLQEAKRLEAEGHHVLKLNIGNPAPFGFEAPEEILQDVILNLPTAHGYGDSKGLLSARRAVVQYYQTKGVARRRHRGRLPRQRRLRAHRDVAAGAARQRRRGARPGAGLSAVDGRGQPLRRHARCTTCCDEQRTGSPTSTTSQRRSPTATRAIVIINPNNPTGAVYPRRRCCEQIVELARRHNLLVFSDEIYDKILYDDATHTSHRRARARPAVPDLQRAVEGVPGGRLPHRLDGGLRPEAARRRATSRAWRSWPTCGCARTCRPSTRCRPRSAATRASTTSSCPAGGCVEQRDVAWRAAQRDPRRLLRQAEGRAVRVPAPRPEGVPDRGRREVRARPAACSEKLLVVQGTGFNWPTPDHFRVVTLPRVADLEDAIGRIGRFLGTYRQ